MKKRIFDLIASESHSLNTKNLVEAIQLSEGRTLMAEIVSSREPPIDETSNVELASAFGADLITLNGFDVLNPYIFGVGNDDNTVRKAAEISCRIIGCNLEPIGSNVQNFPEGRAVSKKTVERLVYLGFQYVILTGNPGTMVSNETLITAIKLVNEITKGQLMIIVGKMHGAGSVSNYDESIIPVFAEAGAHVIMFPAPFTTPGMHPDLFHKLSNHIHERGCLALAAIGTSQEGCSRKVIEQIFTSSKAAGADILHIGDGGYGGIAPVENIMYGSIAIRGKRHTYRRMSHRR